MLYRISIRPEYAGRPMKPSAAALNGAILDLEPLWVMDDDDPYPGETALSERDRLDGALARAGITWIASGDVVAVDPQEQGCPPEQIAAWAREAGDDWDSTLPSDRKFLARFAALVAAHEYERAEPLYTRLEALSKALESSGRIDERDYPDAYATLLDAMNWLVGRRTDPQHSDHTG